jgi:hypothetical protein
MASPSLSAPTCLEPLSHRLSTLHRVILTLNADEIASSGDDASSDRIRCRRRQSLAFFHNINRDAVVEPILLHDGHTPKYPPIVAGDFLMQKHLAAVGEAKGQVNKRSRTIEDTVFSLLNAAC